MFSRQTWTVFIIIAPVRFGSLADIRAAIGCAVQKTRSISDGVPFSGSIKTSEIPNRSAASRMTCAGEPSQPPRIPRKAAFAVEGMASFSICRRFSQISIPASRVIPVRLPPGWARLVTSPALSGSSMNATTGIVLVAAVTFLTTGFVPVTITSGLRATISRTKSA